VPPSFGLLTVYGRRSKTESYSLGEQVPSVTQIGDTYSVSRGTARRALDLLGKWGLTDSVPGWGTFLKARDATYTWALPRSTC
jgi:DNA-binding GntR family transcriptional regulator